MDHRPDPGCISCSVPPGIGPYLSAKKKVLIVDDEYLIRYSLRKIIEKECYEVFTAASGDEALRLFEERKPDIVILDIVLPDTNGLTLLRMIKEKSPLVVVILATGFPDVLSSTEAANMGALDYLEKPISIEHLKTLMRTAVQ